MARPGRAQDVWKTAGNGQRPTDRARRSTGSGRWFLAALLAVGLIGTIVGLLIYLWPVDDPYVLAIAVTTYDQTEWSPNPWAEGDARGFVDVSATEAALSLQAQDKPTISGELNRIATYAGKTPIVVYLSALGVTVKGTPYLIPSEGKLIDPTTWLSLEDIFTPLRQSQAPKLLILDVRPASDIRGVLAGEDVNELLDATLAKLDLPCFVLTANTPADGPNVLRPLGRSVFGLALAQAARGAADGWNADRKRNGRVSACELADYTCALTHLASTTAGLPAQLPRLHRGGRADFELFRVRQNGATQLPELAAPEPYPVWLQNAWKERDAWFDAKDKLHRRAPRMVRQLTLLASRAERQWLAGVNQDTIRPPFVAAFDRRGEVLKSLGAATAPVRSVARARATANISAAEKHLDEVLKLIASPPAKDPDNMVGEAIKKLVPKAVDTSPYDATAVVIFDFARSLEKPTPEQMRYCAALIDKFWPGTRDNPTPTPHHAELVALRLIGRYPEEFIEYWDPKVSFTIRTLLKVVQVSEEAAVADGRCRGWIAGRLEKADEIRRKAMATFFDPKSTRATRQERLEQLVQLEAEYNSIAGLAHRFTHAVHEYEETRAVLVDLATAYPLDDPLNPKVVADGWAGLVENFREMQRLLRAVDHAPEANTLRAATERLNVSRMQLLNLLRVPDFRTIRQIERALRWPHWSDADRQLLIGRLRDAEREAASRVLQGWPNEPIGRDFPAPPKSSERVAANGCRDLRRLIDVLQLADAPGVSELSAEVDRLHQHPTADGVATLSGKVRSVARVGLKQAYDSATVPQRAAFGWAVDPDDVPAFGGSGRSTQENPELVDRRREEREFHRWLAHTRYDADMERLETIKLPALQGAAAGYREIAKAYTEAFPEHP